MVINIDWPIRGMNHTSAENIALKKKDEIASKIAQHQLSFIVVFMLARRPDVDPMLDYCLADIREGGPPLI